MTPNPTSRATNGLLAGICGLGLVVVYYLDRVLGLEPCPLCMTQRVFLAGCGLACLVAGLYGPGLVGRRVCAGLSVLSAGLGAAVAARHVWLQHLPADEAPACGPGLGYLLDTLPLGEVLGVLLMGDGNCAEVVWTFAGLSIPTQALLLFSFLLAASLWQLVRR